MSNFPLTWTSWIFVIVSQLEIKATPSVTPVRYPNHWATRTHVSNFPKQPSFTSFNAIPSFIFNYCIGRLECLPFAILQGIIPWRYNSYWKNVLQSIFYFTWSGAYEQEHATPLYFCHGVFINWFTFGSNLLWMRLAWESSDNQSKDTNWRHCVTGPELPFFHHFTKEKVY